MARPHETLAAPLLTAVWTHSRFAIRSSRAAPAVTAVATVVLGPGIAANTLVFSVIETTLLRPVPYDQPDALVPINEPLPVSEREPVAFDDYRDWRREHDGVRGARGRQQRDVQSDRHGRSGAGVRVRMCPQGLFEVLRVKPFLGRLFTDADDGTHPRRRWW